MPMGHQRKSRTDRKVGTGRRVRSTRPDKMSSDDPIMQTDLPPDDDYLDRALTKHSQSVRAISWLSHLTIQSVMPVWLWNLA